MILPITVNFKFLILKFFRDNKIDIIILKFIKHNKNVKEKEKRIFKKISAIKSSFDIFL